MRKARWNSLIAVFVIVIIPGLLWNSYGFGFSMGLFLATSIATDIVFFINGYYNKEEIAIFPQIENIARQ